MSELLAILGKSGIEMRKMLVQLYGNNAGKKAEVYK
jgi:hypothetical protein